MLFVVVQSRTSSVTLAKPVYIMVLAFLVNASNPLRKRVIPAALNDLISIGVNFALVTALIYYTGGITSDLWFVYALVPAFGALYFGRKGTIVCLALVIGSFTAFMIPARADFPVQTIAGLLFQLTVLTVISAAFALFVEHERASSRKLRESYEEVTRANEKLKQTQAEMIHAARMSTLGQMSTGIIHELAQPLGSLHLYTKLAEEKAANNQAPAEELAVIASEMRRMDAILNGLRSFARKDETSMQPLDLNRVLERVLALVSKQLAALGVTVVTDLAEGLPRVKGNENQLEQVFLNIVTNSRDALDQPHIPSKKLEISTGASPDDHAVELRFRDTGCGIEHKDLENVFEPFFTTKTAAEGLGLGLSICRRIVEEHGGRIDIDSPAGGGTALIVRLPAAGEAA